MKRLKEIQDMNNSVERLWPAEGGTDRSVYTHLTPMPPTANEKIADLEATLDELKESLEKANRRINRLIGEKNQLSTLLGKRDDQIERLSRELGAYVPAQNTVETGRVRKSRPSVPLTEVVMSVIERTGAFFVQWRKESEKTAANPLMPTSSKSQHPYLVARHGGNAECRVVGVLLFGLDRDEIERLLPIVERDCSSRGVKPVCLIDVDAFELLRGRGLIFEYLPPADERDRFDVSLHWNLYIQRRLAIIRRKWNPIRIVAFGPSAMKTLTLWSSSPFEDTPLPAVFSESAKTQISEQHAEV